MPIWTTTISTVTAVGQFYKTNTTMPVISIAAATGTSRAQDR
jgi:hypothetical protein